MKWLKFLIAAVIAVHGVASYAQGIGGIEVMDATEEDETADAAATAHADQTNGQAEAHEDAAAEEALQSGAPAALTGLNPVSQPNYVPADCAGLPGAAGAACVLAASAADGAEDVAEDGSMTEQSTAAQAEMDGANAQVMSAATTYEATEATASSSASVAAELQLSNQVARANFAKQAKNDEEVRRQKGVWAGIVTTLSGLTAAGG